MIMPPAKPLVRIARKARRAAVKRKLRQFHGDLELTAAFFNVSRQNITHILARK